MTRIPILRVKWKRENTHTHTHSHTHTHTRPKSVNNWRRNVPHSVNEVNHLQCGPVNLFFSGRRFLRANSFDRLSFVFLFSLWSQRSTANGVERSVKLDQIPPPQKKTHQAIDLTFKMRLEAQYKLGKTR